MLNAANFADKCMLYSFIQMYILVLFLLKTRKHCVGICNRYTNLIRYLFLVPLAF